MLLFWIIFTIVMLFSFMVFFGAPYVPSRPSFIRQAFDELYSLSDKDVLVDIGSGDGSVLREASRRGSRAVGYEINPLLVILSKLISGKDKKVQVVLTDFWRSHLPKDTTVIYLFCVTRDVNSFTKKLQKEVNLLNRTVTLIVLGPAFSNFKLKKEVGPYHLYVIDPLHYKKLKV